MRAHPKDQVGHECELEVGHQDGARGIVPEALGVAPSIFALSDGSGNTESPHPTREFMNRLDPKPLDLPPVAGAYPYDSYRPVGIQEELHGYDPPE
jgi:hypothetical protein